MKQVELKKATLQGTDILFECRECGKSLAIDCRGAGLNIHCPQCDTELEVPIPEGFDLAEIDREINAAATTLGENIMAEAVPASPVESPAAADPNIALQKDNQTLRAQNEYLTRQHNDMLKTIKAVQLQVREFHKALDELSGTLDTLAGPGSDETQKLV